jgi:hypothetical protein
MNRTPQFREELELDQLLATEQELRQRELEYAKNRQRIEQERIEQERTIPPLDEIEIRLKRKRQEEIVSRGEVTNIRRDQSRSLMLLLLLLLATATMIWWGFELMKAA